MTRALLGIAIHLGACGSGGDATPPAEVAPAPVVPAPDAMAIEIPPSDASPSELNLELEQALRTTGSVIQHIEGHVLVIEDDMPARTMTRQRAMAVAQTVARLLVDPQRDQPRCFRRNSAVVCSQIRRGLTPEGDRRPVFLIYCRGATWRLTTIMLGFNSIAARDVLRDPQQGACP